MLEDFDPSTVRGNPVYQCGVCENNNDLPFAASDGMAENVQKSFPDCGDRCAVTGEKNCFSAALV
jgi:hypothetical protein